MIEPTVVAADHPSLDDQITRFVESLRREQRCFGPSASTNPKPFPSLLAELERRDGFRLAAIVDGVVVGVVRVDRSGSVHIAVGACGRGRGVGAALLAAAAARAARVGFGRLVLQSTRRSRAVRRLGARLGCTTIDLGQGRVDLILPVPRLTVPASA